MVLDKPRLFPPGEGWAYHGSYIALRLVVEAATGIGLGDALRPRGFGPLGLDKTDLVEGPLSGNCAHGYLAAADRYGLGIGEITSVMRRKRSPCGAAWGHLGFSLGYVAIALSSVDGERQVVICANGHPASDDAEEALMDAAGTLAWDLYCA